jgi:hypothetical protein
MKLHLECKFNGCKFFTYLLYTFEITLCLGRGRLFIACDVLS